MTIPLDFVSGRYGEYLPQTAFTVDIERTPANTEALRWYRIVELIRLTNREMFSKFRIPIINHPIESAFKRFCVDFHDHGTLDFTEEELNVLRENFLQITKRDGEVLDNLLTGWVDYLRKTVIAQHDKLPSATN